MATAYVEVNETKVYMTRQGAGFWTMHRPRFEASRQLSVTEVGFMGDLVRVGPYDLEDARFMADHMVDVGGMPRSAVRVRTERTDR